MKITFKSTANALNEEGLTITDHVILKQIGDQHVDCDEDFSEYFHDIKLKPFKYGHMFFEYDPILGLRTIVTYETSLKSEQAEILVRQLLKYTSGQLSDGIGENFEQEPCCWIDDEAIWVSPWDHDNLVYEVWVGEKFLGEIDATSN